jgi:hypothetical protein
MQGLYHTLRSAGSWLTATLLPPASGNPQDLGVAVYTLLQQAGWQAFAMTMPRLWIPPGPGIGKVSGTPPSAPPGGPPYYLEPTGGCAAGYHSESVTVPGSAFAGPGVPIPIPIVIYYCVRNGSTLGGGLPGGGGGWNPPPV